jgi:hypothetical protein
MNRLAVTAVWLRSAPAPRAMRTMRRSVRLLRSARSQRMDHDDLSRFSGIGPFATIENGHIRLQKGQIVSIENDKAKIE